MFFSPYSVVQITFKILARWYLLSKFPYLNGLKLCRSLGDIYYARDYAGSVCQGWGNNAERQGQHLRILDGSCDDKSCGGRLLGALHQHFRAWAEGIDQLKSFCGFSICSNLLSLVWNLCEDQIWREPRPIHASGLLLAGSWEDSHWGCEFREPPGC